MLETTIYIVVACNAPVAAFTSKRKAEEYAERFKISFPETLRILLSPSERIYGVRADVRDITLFLEGNHDG